MRSEKAAPSLSSPNPRKFVGSAIRFASDSLCSGPGTMAYISSARRGVTVLDLACAWYATVAADHKAAKVVAVFTCAPSAATGTQPLSMRRTRYPPACRRDVRGGPRLRTVAAHRYPPALHAPDKVPPGVPPQRPSSDDFHLGQLLVGIRAEIQRRSEERRVGEEC